MLKMIGLAMSNRVIIHQSECNMGKVYSQPYLTWF